jgi:hypothetical protein
MAKMTVSDYGDLFQSAEDNRQVLVDDVCIRFIQRGDERFPSNSAKASPALRHTHKILKDVMLGAITYQTAYALFIKHHPSVPQDVRELASMIRAPTLHDIIKDFHLNTDAFNVGGYCTIRFDDLRHEMKLLVS